VSAAAAMRAAPGPQSRAATYLHPGDLAVSGQPMAITTILGSCVGVCLFDARAGVGGMNHYLLPDSLGSRPSPRFGDVAMPQLLGQVLRAGGRRERLRAGVYGGACVLDAFLGGDHLGERNVEAALRFLADEGIPVLARHSGGRRGRRVVFHTDDGATLMREI
jgi:chemotaxis protein CheD